MKITKKIISLLLAVLMLCGTLTVFSINVAAEEETESDTKVESGVVNVMDDEAIIKHYTTTVYATPEEKLATMDLMTTKGNYQLYADSLSGEVAVLDLTSGQILFTNPYDIGATTAVESVKMELMSQIVVRYTENGRPKEYFSFEYAAVRNQIKVKNIKNGIRVEYTIGREEARRLVPRMIEESRFEEYIRLPLLEYYDGDEENFYFKQFMAYYQLKGLEFCSSDRLKQDLLAVYPVTKDMNIYVFDPTATVTELERLEEVVKTACPNYSYEEMDYDHQMTEYESEDENPPVFKMALEYTIEEDGFSVRLPANGIRFNESKFQLENICVLPYMGTGNNAYEGYTFFPDGSGALFAFEDLVDVTSNSVASKVYGTDYAYHEISGTYQQTVRYPVFGIVEKTRYYDFNEFDENTGDTKTTTLNGMIYDNLEAVRTEGATLPAGLSAYSKYVADSAEAVENVVNRGFVAIIEEGDAMAEIATKHEGVKHPYDSIQMSFYPRPQDTYNMAEAISVGTATDWTVVSTRKYVGNYKIHYVMLTDETIAQEKQIPNGEWYEATWLGMAVAYRDYLVDKGVLAPLSKEEVSGDIPLYIEAFGTIETVEKIMSIPVEVMKPLTTFADVQTMFTELLSEGVNNINFKLTGHANGGMFATAPYKLKWEKSVSKDTDFQELVDFAASINDGDYSVLVDYAKENNIFENEEDLAAFEAYVATLKDGNLGIYPDFDFAYVYGYMDKAFDGLSLRKHAVRTIDDRYTSKRHYYATRQKHMGFYQLAISPAYFDHFYEELIDKYIAYDNVSGISVSTLGDALNSDFDEDEPYNREDSKSFVLQALEYFTNAEGANLDVMVNGGNAYTWQYVDHILGAPLDSSRYIRASYSVPFLGVVLHGYSSFAGSPLNMEGDLNYAKLKAIENGAAVYFTLSYQNTQVLKEDFLTSQYYSVRYDIWYDDVVEIYNELNSVTKDLQDKIIVGHDFLTGMRVPDTDELYIDIMDDFNTVLDFQSNKAEYEEKLKNEAVADARDKIASTEAQAEAFIELCLSNYSGITGAAYLYVTGDRSFERRYSTFVEADTALKDIEARYEAASAEERAEMVAELESAQVTQKQARGQLLTYIRNISRAINTMEKAYTNLSQLLKDAQEGQLLINSTDGIPQSIIDEIAEQLASTEAMMEQQIGVKFDLTVEKAELDTFLHTHIAQLILDSYGEAGATSVGKMENLFNMIETGSYGLSVSEIELLKFLEANRGLSDEAIKEKYDLVEGQSSVSGLLKYMRELLSDKYTFDPTLSDEATDGQFSEVDQHILDYYLTVMIARITGLSDSSVIPALNFVPTRINANGKIVSNTANISTVTNSIKSEITKALTGASGVLSKVEDDNYNLDDLFTDDQWKTLIDACKAIIDASAEMADTKVEYATPDTLDDDLRAYAEALYYQKALENIVPDVNVTTLNVMKVSSKTVDSLELLVEEFIASYDAEDTSEVAMYTALMSDAEVLASVDKIAEMLVDNYGDVKAELLKALSILAADAIVGKKAPSLSLDMPSKAPSLSLDLPSKADEENPVTLKEAVAGVDEIIAAALPTATYDTLADIIADVTAYLAPYAFKEDADAAAEITAYVNYAYMKKAMEDVDALIEAAVPTTDDSNIADLIADVTAILAPLPFEEDADATAEIRAYVYYAYMANRATQSHSDYYYDAQLGKADAAVRAHVAELYAQLISSLPEGADVYDVYNVVLDALTNEAYDVAGVTAEIAAQITHHVDGNNDLAEDVLNYYCYLLLNSFDGYELGDEAPGVDSIEETKQKNALKQIDKSLDAKIEDYINLVKTATARGAIPNFSISYILTDEMLNALCDAEVTALIDALFAEEDVRETLRSELVLRFKYKYYTAALDELGADKMPSFHVAEIYGDDLYTAGQGLKSLLRWYITDFSAMMTDEEIDKLIGGSSSAVEDEDQDESKYLSDDGRIVAVTYGVLNDTASYDDYRTFVLNYNNFSVSVTYDGINYTIPAFSYVVINH